MKPIHSLKNTVSNLPEKKRYAELLTAVLSIPVLITVLLLNINNLKPKTTEPQQIATQSGAPLATQQPTTVIIQTPTEGPTPSLTPPQACIKEVGPIEITSPEEGQIIASNPICIDIERSNPNYCEVAWSYRINNDPWSEYFDKAICLYNLPPGQKTIEVKVKSIASSNQTTLKRSFIIPGFPTVTPTASISAEIQ